MPEIELGQAVFRGSLARGFGLTMEIGLLERQTIEHRVVWVTDPYVTRIGPATKVPHHDGSFGDGIVMTTKFNPDPPTKRGPETIEVPLDGVFAGTFSVRETSDVELVGNRWVFGDVVQKDGTQLPVSLGIRPKTSAEASVKPRHTQSLYRPEIGSSQAVFRGSLASQAELVLQIGNAPDLVEYRSQGRGRAFTVSVKPQGVDHSDGQNGPGIYMEADYTSSVTTSKLVSTSEKFFIPLEEKIEGELQVRSASKVERIGQTWIGSWIFADVVRKDGMSFPVSLGLRPKKD